jgi:hypothetical protein
MAGRGQQGVPSVGFVLGLGGSPVGCNMRPFFLPEEPALTVNAESRIGASSTNTCCKEWCNLT